MIELIELVKNALEDHSVVLIGELHGTKEIPELLGELFVSLAAQEVLFDVCFEIPASEQSLVDKYVESCDDAVLFESVFFHQVLGDGRNSREYFDLIRLLARLNKQYSLGLRVFCVDVNSVTDSSAPRDEQMAQNIATSLRSGRNLFAILGQVHAARQEFFLGDQKIVPCGSYLASASRCMTYSICVHADSGAHVSQGVNCVLPRAELEKMLPDELYDEVLFLESCSPCSFLQ